MRKSNVRSSLSAAQILSCNNTEREAGKGVKNKKEKHFNKF